MGGLRLQEVAPGERGLISLQALPFANTTGPLIELPLELTLSAKECESEPTSFVARLPGEMRAGMSKSHALLHLCFLEHFLLRRDTSRFSPFLQAMPRSLLHLPLLMSPAKIGTLLQGSDLVQDLSKHRRDLEERHDELSDVLPDFREKVSPQDFLWTYCMVESHSHAQHEGNDTTPRMLPLIDLVNHRSIGENLKLAPGPHGGVSAYLRHRSIEPGEELFFRYSALGESSAKFFAQFGFVDAALPVQAKLALPLQRHHPGYSFKRLLFEKSLVNVKLMLERVEAEEKLAEAPGSTAHDFPKFVAWQCKAGGLVSKRPQALHEELLPFARFVVFRGSEDKLRVSCDTNVRPPACHNQLPEQEEVEATQYILAAIHQRLARFSGTLANDDEILRAMDADPGERDNRSETAFLQVRRDERRCLAAALAEVQALPHAQTANSRTTPKRISSSMGVAQIHDTSIADHGLGILLLPVLTLMALPLVAFGLASVRRRRSFNQNHGHSE